MKVELCDQVKTLGKDAALRLMLKKCIEELRAITEWTQVEKAPLRDIELKHIALTIELSEMSLRKRAIFKRSRKSA